MAQEEAIKLFGNKQIRIVWDSEKEKYFFSIVDIIQVLTDTPNARKYWSVLKTRLKKEGSELATNCSQLKLQAADGKRYLTDVADVARQNLEQRLGRSVISSKRAKQFTIPPDELPLIEQADESEDITSLEDK